ncbi:Membrane protein insertase YidC [Burkholderiales bacterium]|nr:Membrane protein insertase YidC [Burkholderiales bacterium]
MEFQRTIIWVVFGMSLVLLWDRWQVSQGHNAFFFPGITSNASKAPPSAPVAGAPASTESSTASAPPTAAASAVQDASIPGAEPKASAASGPVELVHIQTDLLHVDFDAQGAVLVRAELLQQDVASQWTAQGLAGFVTGKKPGPEEHVVLFDRSATREYLAQSGLIGGADSTSLPNHRSTRFDILPGPRALGEGQQELSVRFEAESGGVRLRKTFTFRRGRYDIEVRHEVENVGNEALAPSLYLQLTRDNGKTEEDSSFYKTYTGPAVYTDAEHFRKISFDDIAKHDAAQPKPADNGWLAMVQHYFLSAWIPATGVQREFYTRALSDRLFSVGAILPLGSIAPGAKATQQAVLYAGPQNQSKLEALAPGLDRVADYGWLDPIAKPLFWLLGFLYGIVGNWGWAIVLLTILIKIAFYPLAAAGFKSMARMKEVAPRLAKLKEQYGEDKQKLQVAMMELYKQEKINPLGGCLPILVQIPVFIALYWVLLGSVEMRNAPWILWIHDLATPDPWFVLPALMMLTSWIQYTLQPTPPDPVQAKMMMIMPFVFGVMFFFFPSGLVLYYVLNNGLSILQQWRINKVIAGAKPVG